MVILSACGSVYNISGTEQNIKIELIYNRELELPNESYSLSRSIHAYYAIKSGHFYARIASSFPTHVGKDVIYLYGKFNPKTSQVKNVFGYIVSAVERPTYSARIKKKDALIIIRESGSSNYRISTQFYGEASTHFGVRRSNIYLKNIKLLKIDTIEQLRSMDTNDGWRFAREEREKYFKNY